MAEQATPTFLDVPYLLEASVPRNRTSWLWYAMGAFALFVVLSSYVSGQRNKALVEGMSMVAMLGLAGAMIATAFVAARSAQREQSELEAAEELIQLRRWDQAAALLDGMLSRPARTPQSRIQGLLYLAAVLTRYHRFADAITVYDHILETVQLDSEGSLGLRVGRAMAQLHDDRLFDADRAINELRRAPGAEESGSLALLEIYRDVKTGHPEEAADLFGRRLAAMRKQLGHRLGDAYGLAARAQDMLGHEAEARALYEDATLLVSEGELARRYSELASLAGKYPAATVPGEGA